MFERQNKIWCVYSSTTVSSGELRNDWVIGRRLATPHHRSIRANGHCRRVDPKLLLKIVKSRHKLEVRTGLDDLAQRAEVPSTVNHEHAVVG